jgi:protein-tyrosine-phosphatase
MSAVHSIAFICSANVCRSLMAHAILASEAARRRLAVRVLSAGVSSGFEGMLAAREARLICDRHKTPMPKFIATHIASEDVSGVRRLFAMERSHIASLSAHTTLSPDRISLLGEFDPEDRGPEIDDPIGHDSAAFERCYERLRDCIVHYLDTTHDFD